MKLLVDVTGMTYFIVRELYTTNTNGLNYLI